MSLNTIRGPTTSGFTNHQYINNSLTNAVSQQTGPALPLGAKIYRILSGPPLSYTQMSNSAYVPHDLKEGPLNRENSLEGFHNDVHTMCGNGGEGRAGHMGLTEFAAFDPIFWMHHTCVLIPTLNLSAPWHFSKHCTPRTRIGSFIMAQNPSVSSADFLETF